MARRPYEIQQLETALAQSSRNLDEEIASLGSGWNRERVIRSDPSLVLDEEIRTFMDSWRSCGREASGPGDATGRVHGEGETPGSEDGAQGRGIGRGYAATAKVILSRTFVTGSRNGRRFTAKFPAWKHASSTRAEESGFSSRNAKRWIRI